MPLAKVDDAVAVVMFKAVACMPPEKVEVPVPNIVSMPCPCMFPAEVVVALPFIIRISEIDNLVVEAFPKVVRPVTFKVLVAVIAPPIEVAP